MVGLPYRIAGTMGGKERGTQVSRPAATVLQPPRSRGATDAPRTPAGRSATASPAPAPRSPAAATASPAEDLSSLDAAASAAATELEAARTALGRAEAARDQAATDLRALEVTGIGAEDPVALAEAVLAMEAASTRANADAEAARAEVELSRLALESAEAEVRLSTADAEAAEQRVRTLLGPWFAATLPGMPSVESLAMALQHRWCPWQALLLDDPTQHHDLVHASAVFDLLRDYIADHGFQVLLATHDALQARFLHRKLRNDGLPTAIWTLTPRGSEVRAEREA